MIANPILGATSRHMLRLTTSRHIPCPNIGEAMILLAELILNQAYIGR